MVHASFHADDTTMHHACQSCQMQASQELADASVLHVRGDVSLLKHISPYLQLTVAVKPNIIIGVLVQWTDTTEVAAVQQAIPDSIRDQGVRPPKINCTLIVIARVSPSVACRSKQRQC